MKRLYLGILLMSALSSHSQIHDKNIFLAKEFDKQIALFSSKEYLMNTIIPSATPNQFEVEALAAASSGELTTLFYRCKEKNKEGMLLAFYGTKWNEQGIVYESYGFKTLTKEQAQELLNKIEQTIIQNEEFLKANTNTNNVFFRYDDIDVLIWMNLFPKPEIRLFWNGYDSSWNKIAFERSKARFEIKAQ